MDADLTDKQIVAQPFDLYRQGCDSYSKTHACSGSAFRYTISSLLDLMAFDATDQLELVDVPLQMIEGSEAGASAPSPNLQAAVDGNRQRGADLSHPPIA